MINLLTKFQSALYATITASAVSLVLKSITDIPTAPFMGILSPGTAKQECVLVTAVNTTTKALTIVRAQRGSTAVAHAKNTLFYHSEIELTDIAFGTGYADAKTVASGAYGLKHMTRITDGQSEGLMAYFQGQIAGTTTGNIYGLGAWINTDAEAVLSAGHIIVPFEGGVYAGQAQGNARIVFAGQHQAILAGHPTSLHAWRLNVAAAGGAITALIAAANPGSVGFDAGKSGQSVVGVVPLFERGGVVYYVDVHTTLG